MDNERSGTGVRPPTLKLYYIDLKSFLSAPAFALRLRRGLALYSANFMLTRQLADFLEEGLSTHIASRNERLEPNAARVTALLVEPDGLHVLAFVPAVSAALVMPDLHANGQVALVCARPPDERGCQVKGVFVQARDAGEDERAMVIAQWERFRDKLAMVGLPRVATDAWVTWPCLAIRLRVQALFDQTPGPGAGARLT
jgi:hypothetical protein